MVLGRLEGLTSQVELDGLEEWLSRLSKAARRSSNCMLISGLEGKADKTFADGDALPAGLTTFKFENQKSPGESAFFLKERGVMILGDALIGKVPGKLNMLPPDKYRDSKLAKKGLSKLLDYEFESLLVGDGEPILKDAKEVVKVFLES